MDVIARQHSSQDVDLVLTANLTANVSDPQTQSAHQNFIGVFCGQWDLIVMVVNAMHTCGILHVLLAKVISSEDEGVDQRVDTKLGF